MPGDPTGKGTGEGEVLIGDGSPPRLPRLDWRRLVAEFLVIVVGVLVALAVDDWAQERDDRDFERHILETLVIDVDASVQDLRDAVTSARTRGWCAQWILAETGDPAGPSPHDFGEPDAALMRRVQEMTQTPTDLGVCVTMLGYSQVFDLRDAAFSELQASGKLSAIADPTLRGHIVRFHGDMEDFQESNTIHRTYMFALTETLLSAGVSTGDWLDDAEIVRRLASSRDAGTAIRHVVTRARDQIVSYEFTADAYGAFRSNIQAALEDLP